MNEHLNLVDKETEREFRSERWELGEYIRLLTNAPATLVVRPFYQRLNNDGHIKGPELERLMRIRSPLEALTH